MDWILGGPAAPILGEEDDFGATLAPPPFPAYFPGAVFNPPSPTPSDEDPEHFMPPGYGLVPKLDSPPRAEENDAPPAAAPLAFDLNVQVEPEDEEAFVVAPSLPTPPPASPPNPQAPPPAGPPTPPPKARRILRRFAAAMASCQPGFRAGAWDPASLGLPNGVEVGTRFLGVSSDEEERSGSSSRRP